MSRMMFLRYRGSLDDTISSRRLLTICVSGGTEMFESTAREGLRLGAPASEKPTDKLEGRAPPSFLHRFPIANSKRWFKFR